jgi:guanylate kinase
VSAGRAFPLVLAAPSGAGKTSLARALVGGDDDCAFSVSATTRARREDERDGVHYRFVDEAGFDRLLADGELLEWAVVHGRRYGTPKSAVADALAAGRTVVLDIDVQGARQVRRAFPDAVLVFVLPPSAPELLRRLELRATEDAAQRALRLSGARAELRAVAEFDYVVVNDDLERTARVLAAIVTAERHRRSRDAQMEERVRELDRALDELIMEQE